VAGNIVAMRIDMSMLDEEDKQGGVRILRSIV